MMVYKLMPLHKDIENIGRLVVKAAALGTDPQAEKAMKYAAEQLEEYLTERTVEGMADADDDVDARSTLESVIEHSQDDLFTAIWNAMGNADVPDEELEAQAASVMRLVNQDVVVDDAIDRFADGRSFRRNPNAYFGVSDKDF